MRTVILIINYNNHEDLKACVESCLALDDTDFHVLIVENGSKPDGLEQNRKWLTGLGLAPGEDSNDLVSSKITYHLSDKNLGFGGGNNLGFQIIQTFANQPTFVWLLNNDAVCDRKALSTLVDTMNAEPDLGFAGSLVFDFQNQECIQAAGGMVWPWLGITRHLLKGTNKSEATDFSQPSDYQCGASLLVRYELILDRGGFLPAYFLYFEETDWQIRMNKLGWRNRLVPGSMVYHKESESSRHFPRHFYFHYFRSAVIFLRLNYSGFHLVTSVPFLIMLLVWRSAFSLPMIGAGIAGMSEAFRLKL